MPLPTSKSKINEAGAVLRARATGEAVSVERYRESLETVKAFRACHSYPLTVVTMGLRHHAGKAAAGNWFDLSQRLKQFATISDKLVRLPKTKLARMQDLGGCRATFLDQATVDRAIESIVARARRGAAWDIVDIDDYVEHRRRDGYRAKHVVVRKHDTQIEIQFRTAAQHKWAQLVEDLDKALGLGLKRGSAEAWAVEAVAAAAEDMRQYEYGEIDREVLVDNLNHSLAPLLERSRGRIS